MVVLLAQRLEPEKQTDVAIETWARSSLRHRGWKMAIAGGGRLRADLIELIRQWNLGDSVTLLGMYDDPTSLMSRTSIFLATSPVDSFGFSVVEAMAAGIPVVAARGGAHVETVGRVSDKWLFSPGDASQAASMLDSLGHDPRARARYGDQLRAEQRQHLSLAVHVDHLEVIYEGLSA